MKASLDDQGTGLSPGVIATIDVAEVNDPPSGQPDRWRTQLRDSGPWKIPFSVLTANDLPGPENEGGQSLTVDAVVTDGSDPAHAPVGGTVRIEGADVIFTPDPGFTGEAAFSYYVRDDGTTGGQPDPQTSPQPARVTFVVRAPSPPPPPKVTLSAPATVTRESEITVTGTANPGAEVTVNGQTVWADIQGNWSARVTLREGRNLITAVSGTARDSVIVIRDTVPPALSLHAPALRTAEDSVTLTAEAEEGATVWIEGVQGRSLTVSLAVGVNRFTALAEDAAGNRTVAAIEIIRVETAPEPVVVEPGAGAAVGLSQFRVELAGGAAAQPVALAIHSPTLNMEALERVQGAGLIAASGDVEATGMESGEQVHELNAPAMVRFTYDPSVVTVPDRLRIYSFDPAQQVWVELGGEVDPEMSTITVQVERLATFAALVPEAGAQVMDAPPAQLRSRDITLTGTYLPNTPVTLVVDGVAQVQGMTDSAGRFRLTGTLEPGRNRVYVMGEGPLASREYAVRYLPPYTDMAGHWAEAVVDALHERGVVSLYPLPRFEPEAQVTRMEFAVMVARALRLPAAEEQAPFTDVAVMPQWALPEVAAAVKAGIIKGMPDGSFAPDRLVTRAEMAAMLTRALAWAGLEVKPEAPEFADQAEIPDWAVEPVAAAVRHGLIKGYPDGTFRPGSPTTRAEAATMVHRLLQTVIGLNP